MLQGINVRILALWVNNLMRKLCRSFAEANCVGTCFLLILVWEMELNSFFHSKINVLKVSEPPAHDCVKVS